MQGWFLSKRCVISHFLLDLVWHFCHQNLNMTGSTIVEATKKFVCTARNCCATSNLCLGYARPLLHTPDALWIVTLVIFTCRLTPMKLSCTLGSLALLLQVEVCVWSYEQPESSMCKPIVNLSCSYYCFMTLAILSLNVFDWFSLGQRETMQ